LKYFALRLLLKTVELITVAQAILALAFLLCPKEDLITVPAITPVVRAEAISPPESEVPANSEILPKKDPWAGYPLLKRIAGCESLGDPNAEPTQFLNGEVLHGRENPDDIGLAQINKTIWGRNRKNTRLRYLVLQGKLGFCKVDLRPIRITAPVSLAHCWELQD
jgi:hypothetical protein